MKEQVKRGRVIPLEKMGEHFFHRGIVYYRKRELQQALKYVKRAVQLDPTEPVFQCQLAALYADVGQYEKSNVLLKEILTKFDVTMYECYFLLANNYAFQGLFDKAKETANTYLQYAPDGMFATDAKELLQLLELEEKEEKDKVVSDERTELYQKAEFYYEKKDYEKAEQLLDKLIQKYPTFLLSHVKLSQVYDALGNTYKAYQQLQPIAEKHHYIPALCQVTIYAQKLGYKEEVTKRLSVLTRLIPFEREHAYQLAMTLFELRRYRDMFRISTQFLKRFQPDEIHFFYALGVAACRLGKKELAKKWWLIAAEKGHEQAAELLKQLKEIDDS